MRGWRKGRRSILVVTLDDATSEIYSAFLDRGRRGTASTFRGLLEVFERHGLALSLYTDRGSHYFHTDEAGGKVDRGQPTQVGRALAHLGVEHIAGLLHPRHAADRSVCSTLWLTGSGAKRTGAGVGIVDVMEAANAWLRDTYISAHNARFAVKAEQDGNAFVAVPGAGSDGDPVRPGRTRGRQRQLPYRS